MHMFEYNFTRVFEESAKLDMFRVYLPRQNINSERRFDDAPTELPGAHMYEFSAHRFLQTLEPRDICNQ